MQPPPPTPQTQTPTTPLPNQVSIPSQVPIPTPVPLPSQVPLPGQVSSASQFYHTPVTYPPSTPVPYTRPATAVEQPQRKSNETEPFAFDYHALKNQLQQIATLDEIPVPVENRETKSAEPETITSKPEFDFMSVNATEADSISLKLPPKWKIATDEQGRVYYYHTKTRVSQWYPPAWESRNDEESGGEDGDDVEFKKKRRKSDEEKVEFDVSTGRLVKFREEIFLLDIFTDGCGN